MAKTDGGVLFELKATSAHKDMALFLRQRRVIQFSPYRWNQSISERNSLVKKFRCSPTAPFKGDYCTKESRKPAGNPYETFIDFYTNDRAFRNRRHR